MEGGGKQGWKKLWCNKTQILGKLDVISKEINSQIKEIYGRIGIEISIK